MNAPALVNITDSDRLAMLENLAREPNGILLHTGTFAPGGALLLDLRGRTLREAIDAAFAGIEGRRA